MKTLIFAFITLFVAITPTFSQKAEKHIQKELCSEIGFKIWLQDKDTKKMETFVFPSRLLGEWMEEQHAEWLNDIPNFFNWYTGNIDNKTVYVYFETGIVYYKPNGNVRFKKLTNKQIKEFYK